MRKTKRLLIVMLGLFIIVGTFTKRNEVDLNAGTIKDERELKGIWMSSFIGEAPYSSESQFKAYMKDSFDMFEHYGINALVFHVRTHNNAFYKSELNPVCNWWASANFDVFDPVGWVIEESHKRGIEFHAWMNPYRVNEGNQRGELPDANPQSNPDNIITVGNAKILDPSKEVVRNHIYDTILEFVEMYPTVDAIHFDDYFYIDGAASNLPHATKRAYVDQLMEGIHLTLKDFNENNNTYVQFGISPTGVYKNGRGVDAVTYDENGIPNYTDPNFGSDTSAFAHYGNYLFADTVKWAVEGWIDYLTPQVYWARNHSVASFTKILSWWDKVFKYLDVNLYSGIGVYMADNQNTFDWIVDMNEMDEQLKQIEDLYDNVDGYTIFSYKHLKNGYSNSSLKSGQQIRNAYNDPKRRMIRILPEIKSFEPEIIPAVKNVVKNDQVLTWDNNRDAKFYYIYASNSKITYSTDEIIGVTGDDSFDVSEFDYTNFGVRAISKTNHLSLLEGEADPTSVKRVNFNLGYETTPIPTQFVEIGEKAERPTDPVRVGYKFLGWYLDDEVYDFNKPVTENLLIRAKWEKIENVTLYFDLGFDNKWLGSVTIVKGEKYTKAIRPTRSGYTFLGWHVDDILFNFDEPINSNLTFVAKWERNELEAEEIVVSFDLNYDNLPKEELIVLKGTTISEPNEPTRDGYKFMGWYYGKIKFDFNNNIYEDLNLIAKWERAIIVEDKIEMIDGASIRTIAENNRQRLRFYARVDDSLLDAEVGVYAIFGEISPEVFRQIIAREGKDNLYVNGKEVIKRQIKVFNKNNEFSVVLTGISERGYADKITVMAYAIDEDGNLYLSKNQTSRSVLEVAIKMAEDNKFIDETILAINYVKNNMYTFNYDEYGNLITTNNLYETYYKGLKEAFYKDWNKKFSTNFINPTSTEFFESAKEGSTVNDRNSTNLAPTNIYKFFNDLEYKDRWSWLLDYIIEVDYTIHATGQVMAIKGNGTYNNPNLSNNSSRLYNANHLSYSLYNFFNESIERGGYTAIDFNSTENIEADNKNKYDRYSLIKDFNDQVYINVNKHQFFYLGDTVTLPEINLETSEGEQYVYFDGKQYLPALSQYKIEEIINFEYKLVSSNSYTINYYDGDIELLELKDYYLSTTGKTLTIPKKENHVFLGWYNNALLEGDSITKINIDEKGHKTFYAKWERSTDKVLINYDFGMYGYHTTSKEELFEDFVKDYKHYFDCGHSVERLIEDFFGSSYLPAAYEFSEFFEDDYYSEKWGWLKDYILLTANETDYENTNDLNDYSQAFWRVNIHGFFNNMEHIFQGSDQDYKSIDFADLSLANNFWQYTKYSKYVREYETGEQLVSSSNIKIWHEEYEFLGWYNDLGELIRNIDELSIGEHYLKARFKKK